MTIKEKLKDVLGVIVLWLIMAWEDIKDILVTVAVTFCVVYVCQAFFFKPVVVEGTSMHPTVHDGAVGFSSIFKRNMMDLERFDIVVVKLQQDDKLLIKRLIGLPGETIEFRNDNLYINGVLYEQSFLNSEYLQEQILNKSANGLFTYDFKITLGENEYFCMGDNRLVSADSRLYGPFHKEDIISCGIFVLYPFSDFGSHK